VQSEPFRGQLTVDRGRHVKPRVMTFVRWTGSYRARTESEKEREGRLLTQRVVHLLPDMCRAWNGGHFYTRQVLAANYLLPVCKVAASAATLPVQIYTVSQKKTWCRTFCDNCINC